MRHGPDSLLVWHRRLPVLLGWPLRDPPPFLIKKAAAGQPPNRTLEPHHFTRINTELLRRDEVVPNLERINELTKLELPRELGTDRPPEPCTRLLRDLDDDAALAGDL